MNQIDIFGGASEIAPGLARLLDYVPDFFDEAESHDLFEKLKSTIEWKQETLRLYGKQIPTPRLTAWYGDSGVAYKYSGRTFYALAWTHELLHIRDKLEPVAGVLFNSVLLNLYRDGNDSMGWHSDDEPELGINPVIASVNFGQERRFDFRSKKDHTEKYNINLADGSLLLMKGNIQQLWQHQVAKSVKVKERRINLTFRVIKK
jgi:alkylated DNA repair dioxygenase AlkB